MEHGCPAQRHHRALTDDIIAAISALAVYHIGLRALEGNR